MGLNTQRHLGTVSYGAAGTQTTFELPRTALWRSIGAQFYGTASWTGTETGGAHPEGWAALIRSLEINANGANNLVRADGPMIYRLNQFDRGVAGFLSTMATTASSDDVGFDLEVPFFMPRSVRPIDTAFQAGKWSLLEARFIWGDETDLWDTQAGGSSHSLAGTVALGIEELLLDANQKINPGIHTHTVVSRSFSSVTGRTLFDLPVGNFLRSLLIRPQVGTVPSDTGVLDVSLKSGNTRFMDRMGWGVPDGTAQLRGDLRRSSARYLPGQNVPVGYRWVDFAPDGLLSEMLNTNALEQLQLDIDLSSFSGTVDVLMRSVLNPAFLATR